MTRQGAESLDGAEMMAALCVNLACDDRALAGTLPVVSHMLRNPGLPAISDDVIARIRDMISVIARLLSYKTHESGDVHAPTLELELMNNGGLVNHCYALAVEAALTQQLSDEQRIDPVLPALLQELIESRDANISQLATALMEAQTHFARRQQSGSALLFELSAENFEEVLSIWRGWSQKHDKQVQLQSETELRAGYDEEVTRLGLLEKLIDAVGASAEIISEIETAGLALFVSAIARSTGQPRDLLALSCQQQQCLRLAIALKAAGRPNEAIMRSLTLLGADISLPGDFENWSERQALTLLETSSLGSVPDSRMLHENG